MMWAISGDQVAAAFILSVFRTAKTGAATFACSRPLGSFGPCVFCQPVPATLIVTLLGAEVGHGALELMTGVSGQPGRPGGGRVRHLCPSSP